MKYGMIITISILLWLGLPVGQSMLFESDSSGSNTAKNWHISVYAFAQDSALIDPSPDFSPEQVVEIQLLGLKLTKGDSGSVEMQQVWRFAHPDNKRMTGPLPRFARLFDLPAYRPLLGHVSHEIIRLAERDDLVQLQVQITALDNQAYLYSWIVGKVENGPDEGSWMTMSVSAPRGGGQQS